MEELEVPLEKVQEDIHHHAHMATEIWQSRVALTSALLAVFAALAAMLGGHDANEAMVAQIRASDSWSYYQAKGIKGAIQKERAELLEALGKPVPPKVEETVKRYESEQEEIAKDAKEHTEKSERLFGRHERYAYALTFFQVAIGVAAISLLTKKRRFWRASLVFGLVGLAMLGWGLLTRV